MLYRLLNTAIITTLSVAGELVSSAVVACSFARLRWAARNTLLIVALATMTMMLLFELDDAATIDGCSKFGVFLRIFLPLSKPALAAVAIFSLQFHWNGFFYPLIYLFDKGKFTLVLGLRFFSGNHGTDWHYLMAASLVVMLPVILVFFFAQRIFIQGIVYQGFK